MRAAYAEDVTRDVFVQVLRHHAGFRGEAKFSTWLHRVNAALAYRARRARREERRAHDPLEGFEAEFLLTAGARSTERGDWGACHALQRTCR